MAAAAVVTPADENCTICLEAVSDKRVVSIVPCGHHIHRTCVVKWMEMACCTGTQTCPICRVGIIVLEDEQGKRLLPVRAFGQTGQPSKSRVLTDAAHKSPLDYIKECINEVKFWILEVENALHAPAPTWNVSYIHDLEEEQAKLIRRVNIYMIMHVDLGDDRMRAEFPVGQHRCLHTERERMGRMAQGVRLTRPIGARVVLVTGPAAAAAPAVRPPTMQLVAAAAAPAVRPPTMQLVAPPPPPRTDSRREVAQRLATAVRSSASRVNTVVTRSSVSRGITDSISRATSARAAQSARAARISARATRLGAIPPSLRL